MGAEAYTAGNHIVFAEDGYAPSLVGGKRLLAHELAHVVQQSSGALAAPMVQRDIAEQDLAPSDTAAGLQVPSVVSRAKIYNMIWVWYDALHVGKQRSFSCHG
jgi:hypothetical protein